MPVQVFRAPLRSRLDSVDPGLALDRAFALGLCGVGGRLAAPPHSREDALAHTAEEYDERVARRLERFMAVADGSVVWTRDADGMFRRGTLTGPWSYDADPAAYAADLVNVRDCDWDVEPLTEHRVPPAVAAAYRRGGRNFQRIREAASRVAGAPPGGTV